MAWEVRRGREGGWKIHRIEVTRGMRGSAQRARYQEVAPWIGATLPLTEESRLGLADGGKRGELDAVGLTSLDSNGDGHPDFVWTRYGCDTQLFENNGRDGFRPALLPLRIPEESPGQLCWVDLDGDGLEEWVGTRFLAFEGETGYLGLYSRSQNGFWSLLDHAIGLPVGKGNRSARVHAVTPLDVDSDGRLDLVFAMGGDGPAWDSGTYRPEWQGSQGGLRNFVLRNLGELAFEEIGESLGLGGATCTRQLAPVDWNGDGKVDLYECNADGQPDRLWLANAAGRFEAAELGTEVPSWTLGEHAMALAFPSLGASQPRLWIVGQDPALVDTIRDPENPVGQEPWTESPGVFELEPGPGGLAGALRRTGLHTGAAQTLLRLDVGNRGGSDLAVGSASESRGLQVFLETVPAEGRRDEVAFLLGLGELPPIQAGLASDVDGDGDLDLILAGADGSLHLMADTGPHGAALECLPSAAQASPWHGRIEVAAAGQTQNTYWNPLGTPGSQQGPAWHVGLGSIESSEPITLRWPSGSLQSLQGMPAASARSLVEPAPEASERAAWPTPLEARGRPPVVGGYARLLDGSNHALGAPGKANVVVWVAAVDRDKPWPFERVAAWSRADLARSLVVIDSDGWLPPPDAPYLAYVGDRALRTEYLGTSEEVALPATFVFDASGQLARRFGPEASQGDILDALDRAANPKDYPEVLVREGFRALELRQYPRALSGFVRAVERDPSRADAFLGLTLAQRYLGNSKDALVAVTQAARCDPDFALAHQLMGTLLLSQGEGAQAADALRRVLELEGDQPKIWYALSEATLQAGQWQRGMEAIGKTLELLPLEATAMRADAHCLRGKLLEHLGRDSEARESYERSLALDPAHPEALDCRNRLLGRAPE